MDGIVDLAGRVRLAFVGVDPVAERAIRRRMEPYEAVRVTRDAIPRLRPDVIVELDSGPEPRALELAGDTGDGLVTAWDGHRLHLRSGSSSCALPVAGEHPARFSYRAGFPLWSILGPLVAPELQFAALDHGAVVAHASAVEVDGTALLIGGWSESGKTEVALGFAVGGDRLVSDKWTLLDEEGAVAPFPAPLTIRRWLLRYLPELREALPPAARARFALAGGGAALLRPLGGRAGGGPVSGLALRTIDRTIALAERTPLSPSAARLIGGPGAAARAAAASRDGQGAAGRPALPLGAAVLLTTSGAPDAPIEAEAVDPCWAAQRLARSAAAERAPWADTRRREAYAALPRAAAGPTTGQGKDRAPEDPTVGARPAGAPGAGAAGTGAAGTDGPAVAADERLRRVRVREEEALARILAGVPVLEVRAPFPSDPRRIVETIRANLPPRMRPRVSA